MRLEGTEWKTCDVRERNLLNACVAGTERAGI